MKSAQLAAPSNRQVRKSLVRTASLLVLVAGIGCSSPSAPSIPGTWGGQVASLQLGPAGGTVAYQCGAGTIDSGWTLKADGQFTATGQHYFGGGPAPAEGRPPHPARYSGIVEGNRLTLTVTLTDLGQILGPFQLIRGGPAVHELCV
jgi:hypothetical protein